MDVTQEEWLTTGQAAKIAARDIRTIRRWIDEGRLKARISPGGHRQIALSSLVEIQRPASRRTAPRRRRGGGRVLPPECLPQWADVIIDWPGWTPAVTTSSNQLRDMVDQIDDVHNALTVAREALLQVLDASSRPEEGGTSVLDWLRSLPAAGGGGTRAT